MKGPYERWAKYIIIYIKKRLGQIKVSTSNQKKWWEKKREKNNKRVNMDIKTQRHNKRY